MADPESDGDRRVNLTELARIMGVTRPAVSYWVKQGLPRGEDGLVSVAEARRWKARRDAGRKGISPQRDPTLGHYQPRKRGDAPAVSQPATSVAEEYRRIKTQREALKLAREKGLVVPRDRVYEMLSERALELRVRLQSACKRLPPLLVGKSEREIEATLEETIREALDEYVRDAEVVAE